MTTERLIGLSDEEVILSREKHGENTSEAESRNRFWQTLKEVITEPLFIILICAALIYLILGEYDEGIIMMIALCFVSGISLYQENRSRNAVDALKQLSNPLAKVIRDGKNTEIPSEKIVIDDLIVVEDGNIIPADAQILKANDFSVNESILTGESLAVLKKNSPQAFPKEEKKSHINIIFQGTTVTSGSCVAQVIAIGKSTELGKIGQSLQKIDIPKTPLQKQIKAFIRSMVIAGTIAFLFVLGINYYQSKDFLHSLLHGLTLAMSILPEEIPVAFSTFMALGAYHLYKKKVIARNPHTVETLGAATVICVDKTGTITENNMQLSAIYDYSENKIYDYIKEPFSFNIVLEYALWASETEPFDAMEKSIHTVYASASPIDKRPNNILIHEYPLSGSPPIMTHVFSDKKGHHIIACKGGVEGVLNLTKLSSEEKTEIQNKTNAFARKGFRVLAVAKANHDINNLPISQQDFEFIFLGLIAFYDPPKRNISHILRQFSRAGINVKMITGDYPETAIAIADQINFKNSTSILTGNEVMEMSEEKLRAKINDVNIYARMFPDAKLKVIEALKANAEVVAMTGDGVNDGPALKAAHIGIAMGMRGSEIAKKAATLILMDDDLSHMIDAIALGRRIYENLKKAIQYIISIHIPIIFIVTMPLLLGWKFTDFFSPVHVIFLELIMGPTCSIIFENEPIEANSMQKKPRKMSKTFFSVNELALSIIQGLVITIACLSLGYYYILQNVNENTIRTIIYATLIFSNLFLTLSNRSFYYSILTTLSYKNKLIPLVLIVSLLVLFLSIYLHPIQVVFQFEVLKITDVVLCLFAAFLGVLWVELYKLFQRKKKQRRINEK